MKNYFAKNLSSNQYQYIITLIMGSLFSGNDVSAIVFNNTQHKIYYRLATQEMKTVQEMSQVGIKIQVDLFSPGFAFTSPKTMEKRQLFQNQRYFPCYQYDFSRESLQSKDKLRPGTMISFYQVQKAAGKNKKEKLIYIGDGNLPKGIRAFSITERQNVCEIRTLIGFKNIYKEAKKYDSDSLGKSILGLIERLWVNLSENQKQAVKEEDPDIYKMYAVIK